MSDGTLVSLMTVCELSHTTIKIELFVGDAKFAVLAVTKGQPRVEGRSDTMNFGAKDA